MLRWIGAVVGFFGGFIGCLLFFAYLATQQNIDVFHMYVSQPVAPPGGYRTPLDVPPATWPSILAFVVALLFGKLGASLGRRLGSGKIAKPIASTK